MTRIRWFLIALALASTGAMFAAPAEAAPPPPRPKGPCDIYNAAGTPCVTAHSTARALLSTYNGPLYQVKRQSDDRLLDIGIVHPRDLPVPDAGGYADAAAQDRFCVNTLCVITRIYDQSGKGNHLYQAPPGPFYPGPAKGAFDAQPIADMAPIAIAGGHKAYGVYIMPGMGFRNNGARDLPINDEPAGIHVVVDGKHYSNGCCFNYGNASTNGLAVGTGTMESVYFGNSSGWGSGSGTGPWIMSDMEAGLFSGYNAGVNAGDPTIDWRFVTGVFGGGGRNFWTLLGGNAQQGALQTFYEGVRPGSKENNAYFPMHKKGAIQMGNGGDNGNGSAGTFYEGVMTAGQPATAITDAVQANVVSARYDVPLLTQSRLTSFSPRTVKDVTAIFTNSTGATASDVTLGFMVPAGWTARGSTPASFAQVAPGASVRASFQIASPGSASSGFVTARATWRTAGQGYADASPQRVRSAERVKINEVRFASGGNATNQFVELYNASSHAVDISNWKLINTRTFFASVPLATIPTGTKLAAHGFYLLGLASSGLAAPAEAGATSLNLRGTDGFMAGQHISIDGENRTVKSVGTAATVPTIVFMPVSTGPWLTVPAGSTNVPVANAAGFAVGQKIGIDAGGHFEIATVTAVGKAATQSVLAVAAVAGSTNIKPADVSNLMVGDVLSVGTGQRLEWVKVLAVGAPGADGTGVTLTAPLKFDNMVGVDVAGRGTGISFAPATRFAHLSGDAVQALGSGITLDRPLARSHGYGAPVVNPQVGPAGYQGPAPNLWFGGNLSIRGGSIALADPSGKVLVDAIVYGSRQGNSSASGAITSPEIATLEGVQHQGGCIAVIPGAGSGPSAPATALAASARGAPDRSAGRFPDGADTDSLCDDFMVQPATIIPQGAAAGATSIKVASVADFVLGQAIAIGAGEVRDSAVIAAIGTSGASVASDAVEQGGKVIAVASTAGFSVGQTITVGNGADAEDAVISLVQGGRGSARITVAEPLGRPHAAGTQISGSGITVSAPLTRAYAAGAPITAELPTPGAANLYSPGSERR
ncbi:MAG: arabinofuranosidase catalytic domain-containing protein [Sphingomonas sp.]